MEDDDWSDILSGLRGDGGFRFKKRHFGEIEEAEDARDALASLALPFDRLINRGVGNDPPDCEAYIEGARWGIEITELIHAPTMQQRLQGISSHHEWTEAEFRDEVAKKVEIKDRKKLKGGPYERYLLVVITREMYLHEAQVEIFLRGFEVHCSQLTDICIGLGYHGSEPGSNKPEYPALPVRVHSKVFDQSS